MALRRRREEAGLTLDDAVRLLEYILGKYGVADDASTARLYCAVGEPGDLRVAAAFDHLREAALTEADSLALIETLLSGI
jgi:hypothetical protein